MAELNAILGCVNGKQFSRSRKESSQVFEVTRLWVVNY